jgi:hypothetical protein
VQFSYLQLASAANASENGTSNVLGLGTRILTYERLPAVSPLVIVGSVAADVSEAGEYPITVAVVEPDGTREELVNSIAKVGADKTDPRIPTGIGFAVEMVRPWRIEGVHRIEARVGDLEESYEFLVQRSPSASGADSTRPQTRRASAKVKATGF